jgi:DNA-3-methyladenine glycosylase II
MASATEVKTARPRHYRALAALRRDERLAEVIAAVGPYRPNHGGDGFAALVRAIASQQVSKYASEAILGRLYALFPEGELDPARLLRLRLARLTGVGLSARKAEYLRDLARHVVDGRIDFDAHATLSDDAVIESLTAVKGIGRWTAEMYLMFTLGRPDILPLGDVALVNIVRTLYGLPAEADATHFGAIAESWRPWRSVACWYLYRSINMQRAALAAAKRAAAGA